MSYILSMISYYIRDSPFFLSDYPFKLVSSCLQKLLLDNCFIHQSCSVPHFCTSSLPLHQLVPISQRQLLLFLNAFHLIFSTHKDMLPSNPLHYSFPSALEDKEPVLSCPSNHLTLTFVFLHFLCDIIPSINFSLPQMTSHFRKTTSLPPIFKIVYFHLCEVSF